MYLYLCSFVFVYLPDNEREPLNGVCTQRKYVLYMYFFLFILYMYLDRGRGPLDGVCTKRVQRVHILFILFFQYFHSYSSLYKMGWLERGPLSRWCLYIKRVYI